MSLREYIDKIDKLFLSSDSTEHSYRGDLQTFIESFFKNISVINEPKRNEWGAPDYIIKRKEVPIGYIETKNIDADLDKIEKSEQMKRYLSGLENLILTNYLEFRFYRYEQKIKTVKIGFVEQEKIKPLTDNFSLFEGLIKDFCQFGLREKSIKSAGELAPMLARKARMLEHIIYSAVSDRKELENNSLIGQLRAFKKILIHDLNEEIFADIYAQTIAYGLFIARLNDNTSEDFSRQKARDLIPRSNPFLRSLFDYVCGAQLDNRVVWIVDDLCSIFHATHLRAILENFGKATAKEDPFLHFYETFLSEYNPQLRKSRGVYYTPEPVVKFIVGAVDAILKKDFSLSLGLADTSKIKREKGGEKMEIHKVQILDPATGTGTFLAETVKKIYSQLKGQEGLWSGYVEEHLLPRLNGFEVLMASYTMCHLKIEMILRQMGYKPQEKHQQERLKVFLTNSLEESTKNTESLFATWLSEEAEAAKKVKEDTPIMCVLGNPPYSGESQNKGKWMMKLMEDYKKEPGGRVKLNERNSKWINDDYVKFIRYGQHFIEKNSNGILAFINPTVF